MLNVFPAYGIDGARIPAEDLLKRLNGSLVKLNFGLHFTKNSDAFGGKLVASIQSVEVLVPAATMEKNFASERRTADVSPETPHKRQRLSSPGESSQNLIYSSQSDNPMQKHL